MGLRDRFTGEPKPKGPSTILGTRAPMKPAMVTVNLHLNATLESGLQQVQSSLSWIEEPMPISWVFEWLHLRVKEHKDLAKALEEYLKSREGMDGFRSTDPGEYETFRKTSFRLNHNVNEWMAKVTHQSSYSAPTVLLQWATDQWPHILKVVGSFTPKPIHRSQRVASR